jgi:CBS domain-containing protein
MEAETPGDEFAIAGVGPLASVIFGAFFLSIAWLGGAANWSPAVTVVASYLGLINLVLAVFNLLPGFPLDGGRVFRAAVWKITGDLTRATRWAVMGGRSLGYLLMAFGIFQAVFTPGVIGGLWLVFIGWFIRSAADASLAQHLLRQTLRGISVRDVMTADPVTVPAHLPLDRLVEEYFIRGRHRVYPVVDGERLLGTVALERVREIPRVEWPEHTVADAMTPLEDTPTAEQRESVTDVLGRITRESDGRVLVTRNGYVEGILTRADLARWVERADLMK